MLKNLKLFISFALIIAFISGCGKTDQQQQQQQTTGDNKTGDQQQQQQQQQSAGDQTQTKTDSKNELGIKDGLPSDYPSDVPKPVNSKAMGYLNTMEGTVVTFESPERPKIIFNAFSQGLEKGGFKKGDGEIMSDSVINVIWTKDKREVGIMLAWLRDKNNSTTVVTYK